MAEAIAAVGFAAAVAQFGSLTVKVVRRIDEYASTTQDVPETLRAIQVQLPFLTDTCQRFQNQETSKVPYPELLEVVQGCTRTIEELHNLLYSILPSVGDSSSRRLIKAYKSVRVEKRLSSIQHSLETFKTTLTLYASEVAAGQVHRMDLEVPDRFSHVPTSQLAHFVGRKKLLEEIQVAIKNNGGARQPPVVVLLGMGGQGKTQLAFQTCRICTSAGGTRVVIWIDATSRNSLTRSLESVAERMNRNKQTFKDLSALSRFVLYTIDVYWKMPWLVVFDNFDEPAAIRDIRTFFPTTSNGAIIITSRHADSSRLATALIPVTAMNEDDSIDLLFSQTVEARNDNSVNHAKKIVHKLGFLALAIDQAAAYIGCRRLPMAMFLQDFEDRKELILRHTPDLWEYRKKLNGAEVETALSAFTTWELSVQQIGDDALERAYVTHMLTLFAFLNHTQISEILFRTYFESAAWPNPAWMHIVDNGGSWDSRSYRDVVSSLLRLSLLQGFQLGAECEIALHPLISEWMKLRLGLKERQEFTVETIRIVDSFIKSDQTVRQTVDTIREVLSHMDACVHNDANFVHSYSRLGQADLRDTTIRFATYYDAHGRYQVAEQLLRRTLDYDESSSGVNSPPTIQSALQLSVVYYNLGNYSEAEVLAERGIKGYTLMLGCDSVLAAVATVQLARIRRQMARYDDALRLLLSAQSAYSKLLKDDDEKVLQVYEELAMVYRKQGLNDDAVQYLIKILAVYEKNFCDGHVPTLRTLSTLSAVYRVQCKMLEAVDLSRRALRGYVSHLGPDHLATVNELQNLAIALRDNGDYNEAEELLQSSIATSIKTLGEHHPQSTRGVSNLGVLYEKWGRYVDAERLLGSAFRHRQALLGHAHPTTVRTAEALGHVYLHQRLYTEVKSLFQVPDSYADGRSDSVSGGSLGTIEAVYLQALAREERLLSKDHPDTLASVLSLGRVYQAQGRLRDCEACFRRATEGYKARFGADHVCSKRAEAYLVEVQRAQPFGSVPASICNYVKAHLHSYSGLLNLEMISWPDAANGLPGLIEHARQRVERLLPPLENIGATLTCGAPLRWVFENSHGEDYCILLENLKAALLLALLQALVEALGLLVTDHSSRLQ